MDGNILRFEKVGDAVDSITHHRAPDVVGVVVRCKDTRQGHSVSRDDSDQFVDRVRRVDNHALLGHLVAEEIHVVDHLRSETVADREVAAGQQLAKVKPVISDHADRLWRTLFDAMDRSDDVDAQAVKVLVGDVLVDMTPEMSAALSSGGRLVGLRSSGSVLIIPGSIRNAVNESVTAARRGFVELQRVDQGRVDRFFEYFADLVDDDASFAPVLQANAEDVAMARSRGRSTGRLVISEKMRRDMSAGLRMWAGLGFSRLGLSSSLDHIGWTVESWRAPLGVVAFVFEGRPNVFADATGVLKSGNSVVFRIGSDALRTARAIRDHALFPALDRAGLPREAVNLIDSAEHSAGWALFDDSRLSLAVARGSGAAVSQLGEIARQAGTPVSLHGTGGAWMIVGSNLPGPRLTSAIVHSLDRKVCNTLNTLVVLDVNRTKSLEAVAHALGDLARATGGKVIVHAAKDADGPFWSQAELDVQFDSIDPGEEWEWDETPEITVICARSLEDAVEKFNRHSPRFVLSVLSDDEDEVTWAWENSESPFFGDGFTRWVDGQFALSRPELGLANWQSGRLLGRGGVLSGDGVHTMRLRVRQADPDLHR